MAANSGLLYKNRQPLLAHVSHKRNIKFGSHRRFPGRVLVTLTRVLAQSTPSVARGRDGSKVPFFIDRNSDGRAPSEARI
jgi:hypothetical protein